ncbi:MAG: lycopene cyclase domain-containing protein [Isosphaeraceae bacterium]|nr:lycopene cyclase domain-containing protein [Isosphaeraceae bacterium]
MDSTARARETDRLYGYKATAIIILTIVVPSIITLMSVREPRTPMYPPEVARPISPYGYTLSLSLFAIPVLMLGLWFQRHPRFNYQRTAFWITLACLIPAGFLLDLIWGCTFFTFPNREAVIGIWIPARGGEVPLEEFFFYSLGFIAVLKTYIWLDEYWLRAYHVDRLRLRTREIPRVIQFHAGPIVIGALLFLVGLVYKKLWSDHPEGIPGYYLFELAVAVVPTMLLYRTAAPFINWRALTFTYFLLMLVSLLWEATVALPYGWWGYKPEALIGITIWAWTNLPIEEPLLWSSVSIATIVWYEAMKVFLAMDRSPMHALFGIKPPCTPEPSDPEPAMAQGRRRRRHRRRLNRARSVSKPSEPAPE